MKLIKQLLRGATTDEIKEIISICQEELHSKQFYYKIVEMKGTEFFCESEDVFKHMYLEDKELNNYYETNNPAYEECDAIKYLKK